MTGTVYLVGAGPGDAGLLTRRAATLIETADVIVYDRLVGQGVLALLPDTARLIDVGKNSGDHPVPQDEIGNILVREAKKSKTVVRLKGGDPFVFGRGGEEAELLSENGISYEIVPGVTSAVSAPAYAGIPVTHRDFASSLHIITGHGKRDTPVEINYNALVQLRGTLVFLMSVSTASDIMAGLLGAGMNGNTPAAIVENGAALKQRDFVCKLKNLHKTVVDERIVSPAVIIVGKVCSMRDKLAWIHRRKLHGCRILVTRPKTAARQFGNILSEMGAEVLYYPCIQTEPLDFDITSVKTDWVAFTAAAGVEVFFEKLYAEKKDARVFGNVKIAAVGEKTAKKLREFGICADFIPAVYDGDALVGGLLTEGHVKSGDRVTLYRAREGDAEICSVFEKAGAIVTDIPVYDTVLYNTGKDLPPEFDIVTFTSASCVRGFVKMNKTADFSKMKAVCIGDKTAAAARDAGMQTVTSEKAVTESMAIKLTEVWNGQKTEKAEK